MISEIDPGDLLEAYTERFNHDLDGFYILRVISREVFRQRMRRALEENKPIDEWAEYKVWPLDRPISEWPDAEDFNL